MCIIELQLCSRHHFSWRDQSAGEQGLAPAGAPPDTEDPELLRQVLLALALQDEDTGGAQAAELADRALELSRADRQLDPPAALAQARAAAS